MCSASPAPAIEHPSAPSKEGCFAHQHPHVRRPRITVQLGEFSCAARDNRRSAPAYPASSTTTGTSRYFVGDVPEKKKKTAVARQARISSFLFVTLRSCAACWSTKIEPFAGLRDDIGFVHLRAGRTQRLSRRSGSAGGAITFARRRTVQNKRDRLLASGFREPRVAAARMAAPAI